MARARKLAGSKLNLVFVDDAEMRELNRDFLGHDRPTDVLSFQGEGNLLGEIVISVDTARAQARERGVPIQHELALLAVHGFLHLTGYDDTTLAAWRKMRAAEFESIMGLM